jgi:hypothetical protein
MPRPRVVASGRRRVGTVDKSSGDKTTNEEAACSVLGSLTVIEVIGLGEVFRSACPAFPGIEMTSPAFTVCQPADGPSAWNTSSEPSAHKISLARRGYGVESQLLGGRFRA